MVPVLLVLAIASPPSNRLALDPDRLQFRGIDDDAPVRNQADNPLEYEAYNTVLQHARQFTATELLSGAERDVTFRDLVLLVRQDFRLKLVALDGRLLGVRKYAATPPLIAAGVPHLYECWLVPDTGSAPLCFQSTELPPGLEPRRTYDRPVPVTAVGYVFKLMRYESSEPHPTDRERGRVRKAPLLMGHSLILRPVPSSVGRSDPWATGFVPGLVLAVGGLGAIGLGLTAWYRRGDRSVQAELERHRQQNPFADSPSGVAP